MQNGIAQHTNFFSYQIGDYTNNIDTTKDGGYIVSGASFGNINGNNFLISKLDKDGNLEWDFQNNQFHISGDSDNVISRVTQTLDKGFIGVGYIQVDASPTNVDLLIVKLDSSGNLKWRRNYNIDPYLESFTEVFINPDSTYLGLGWGLGYYLLMKFGSDGDTLWTRKIPVSTVTLLEHGIPFNNGYYFFGVTADTVLNIVQQKIIYVDSLGFIQWGAVHADTAEVQSDFMNYWITKDSILLAYNHMKTLSGQYYFRVAKYDYQGVFLGSWITNTVGKIASDSTIIGSYNHIPFVPDTLYIGRENFYTGAFHEYYRYPKNGGIINSKVFMVDRYLNCLMGGKHDPSGFGFQAFVARFVDSQTSYIGMKSSSEDFFLAFPNPTSTWLNILVGNGNYAEGTYTITLYDVLGQKIPIKTRLNCTSSELDVRGLKPGVYYLQLKELANRKTYPLKKIIIN